MTDRKEKLLAAARERLLAKERKQQANQQNSSGRQMMYRGQAVNRSGGSAPGASSNAAAEVQAALEHLKQLYHDGLISRSEAEEQRAKLLERLDP